MAHIHEKIDFTAAIFIVHGGKILLIHHRNLNKWLPLGGHIELDEDPETAALREAKEESGLEVELLGERSPNITCDFLSKQRNWIRGGRRQKNALKRRIGLRARSCAVL